MSHLGAGNEYHKPNLVKIVQHFEFLLKKQKKNTVHRSKSKNNVTKSNKKMCKPVFSGNLKGHSSCKHCNKSALQSVQSPKNVYEFELF